MTLLTLLWTLITPATPVYPKTPEVFPMQAATCALKGQSCRTMRCCNSTCSKRTETCPL